MVGLYQFGGLVQIPLTNELLSVFLSSCCSFFHPSSCWYLSDFVSLLYSRPILSWILVLCTTIFFKYFPCCFDSIWKFLYFPVLVFVTVFFIGWSNSIALVLSCATFIRFRLSSYFFACTKWARSPQWLSDM